MENECKGRKWEEAEEGNTRKESIEEEQWQE